MLELNNYYIKEVENLTDLFTIIYTIVNDIYKDIKLLDSEIITISIVEELLTIDSILF